MIDIKKLKDIKDKDLSKLLNRFGEDFSRVLIDTVIPIVNDVRANGDEAVKKYTKKYDNVKLTRVAATDSEIQEGANKVDTNVLNAFMLAKENIEEFHNYQKKEIIKYKRDDGTTLGLMYQPIERAAMYVPGGKASYPSSVLMSIIPAQIAGVGDITIITPPDKNGNVNDMTLAMCKILGINKIYKAGGAQGIAALAFGTESIDKADIIVGPGNVYVTAAKSYLYSLGVIGIDSMAGPSEILVIADENANPEWVAYDMLSQAEHEEQAIAILVTTSEELAIKVKEEIEKDIKSGQGRAAIKKTSISENGTILLVDTIEQAIEFSNSYAPEHMEMMVNDPSSYLEKIKNVGSLFLGHYSPVAVGDYFSGTNHILPTGGISRFSSGLSVETFLRRTSFQELTEQSLSGAQGPVNTMSKFEGFDDKHGGSVNIRFGKK